MRGHGAMIAVAALLAAPAAASAAPRVGDWEGTGAGGAVGSFALTSVTTRSHGQVAKHLAVEDLVVQAPITCANAFGTPLPVDVEVITATIHLNGGDGFRTGKIRSGGTGTSVVASYRNGRFRVTYRRLANTRNLYEGGTETCDTGRVHLSFKPGHRRKLRNGVWEGQTAEQEPVQLNVVAGGRALESPSAPGPGGVREYAFQVASNSATDPCAYQISSPLFIGPNGGFSNSAISLGDDAVVSGKLGRSGSGSGEFSYQAQSCLAESWSARWSFK